MLTTLIDFLYASPASCLSFLSLSLLSCTYGRFFSIMVGLFVCPYCNRRRSVCISIIVHAVRLSVIQLWSFRLSVHFSIMVDLFFSPHLNHGRSVRILIMVDLFFCLHLDHGRSVRILIMVDLFFRPYFNVG